MPSLRTLLRTCKSTTLRPHLDIHDGTPQPERYAGTFVLPGRRGPMCLKAECGCRVETGSSGRLASCRSCLSPPGPGQLGEPDLCPPRAGAGLSPTSKRQYERASTATARAQHRPRQTKADQGCQSDGPSGRSYGGYSWIRTSSRAVDTRRARANPCGAPGSHAGHTRRAHAGLDSGWLGIGHGRWKIGKARVAPEIS